MVAKTFIVPNLLRPRHITGLGVSQQVDVEQANLSRAITGRGTFARRRLPAEWVAFRNPGQFFGRTDRYNSGENPDALADVIARELSTFGVHFIGMCPQDRVGGARNTHVLEH
jgi:hypothetical protein